MASPTEENYLKALFNLKDEEGKVSISELSSTLEVSMPTANSMVKNLLKKGLIIYEKYKPIELTEEGKKMAALVIRKHRLTEMYLAEKMGFGWEEVHDIAEQIEHINSPIFFERMDKLLNHPKIDPHGSPIPNAQGIIADLKHKPLNEHKPGDAVKLAALAHSSTEFLDFLNSRNLKLGTEINVISVEPFDGSMVVSYNDRKSEGLSAKVCERLLVEFL
ncbi:metal-dependent transcriptional regulator [Cryomorpha ignava]|uniref:Transcriptional regulator MntR n=1 Tax=Cryomorpha ignava TaxID=101383 RepID=A0A7K3WKB6_9FLAO|nr:metal-dependent transcriptional regulator [Cryomorpha ignava]NEN21934.1 metal-dependent transcriptional regulator [Cryomorpha ignava]